MRKEIKNILFENPFLKWILKYHKQQLEKN